MVREGGLRAAPYLGKYHTRAAEREFNILNVLNGTPTDMETRTHTRLHAKYGDILPSHLTGGTLIPPDLFKRAALSTLTPTGGGVAVGVDVPESVIEALRPLLLSGKIGVRFVEGLQGNFQLPRFDTGSAASWVFEDALMGESVSTYAAPIMVPRTCGLNLQISRQMLQLATPNMEQEIIRDFASALSSAIDIALFSGSGPASGQPTGIINTVGIDSRSGATFSAAIALAMMKAVELSDVNTSGACWVMPPTVAELLRQRPKATGSGLFLITDEGTMFSKPVYVSTAAPASSVIFGDFSQAIIGSWGVPVVVVDPYAAKKKGITEVQMSVLVDVALRHPKAFALATTVS